MFRIRGLRSWLFTRLPILVRSLRVYLLWVNMLFFSTCYLKRILKVHSRRLGTTIDYKYLYGQFLLPRNKLFRKGKSNTNTGKREGVWLPLTYFLLHMRRREEIGDYIFSLPHLLIWVIRVIVPNNVDNGRVDYVSAYSTNINVVVNLKGARFLKTIVLQFVNIYSLKIQEGKHFVRILGVKYIASSGNIYFFHTILYPYTKHPHNK